MLGSSLKFISTYPALKISSEFDQSPNTYSILLNWFCVLLRI